MLLHRQADCLVPDHADCRKYATVANCSILSLYHQMYNFAARAGITRINASQGVKIEIPDDDEHGIRFTAEDIATLWEHTDDPNVKIVLIYLYTGWRATELIKIPKTSISLDDMTMTGGKKTAAGKNRVVPIHPRIQGFTKIYLAQLPTPLCQAHDKK